MGVLRLTIFFFFFSFSSFSLFFQNKYKKTELAGLMIQTINLLFLIANAVFPTTTTNALLRVSVDLPDCTNR